MSEQPKTPEKSAFKEKHTNWLLDARKEMGSLGLGVLGGGMTLSLLMLLGITNPIGLIGGALATVIGGYHYIKSKE